MQKTCAQCSAMFEVTDSHLQFYNDMSPMFGGRKYTIPPSNNCPTCRRMIRHAFRNERNMYHRKCDLTGKQILSIYRSDGPTTVYEHETWWGDTWDATDYGKDFDFTRPFFEQFGELLSEVPRMNIQVTNVENCDFCNLIADAKNCYLVFETSNAEDCYYGYWLQKCKDCCDASFSHECEKCYEIDNCYQSQFLRWCQNCTNCFDSEFLLDCIGCSNCMFCVNLRQKEYCIFNEQLTKEEYEKRKAECLFGSRATVDAMKQRFAEFILSKPRKHMTSVQEDNCTGNHIQECRDCIECFHAHESESCTYAEHLWRGAKLCMDVVTAGRGAEMIYQSTNTNMGAAFDAFTVMCWGSSNVYYSSECCTCKHCFGCANLKHKQYCIFNKQYTKEEYDNLVPKIIEHMKSHGEWGEYFPPSISLFGYNESMAQEYFPLEKADIQDRGWKWLDETTVSDQYLGPDAAIPDNISDASDDCTGSILKCSTLSKPYKIIPQELQFYRDMNVPVPLKCPYQRHNDRMALRNPLKLWDRTCTKCQQAIQTTYSPDRKEIVYCEECYLSEVY